MKITTRLVHVGVGSDSKTGAISTPIYQSATFRVCCEYRWELRTWVILSLILNKLLQ